MAEAPHGLDVVPEIIRELRPVVGVRPNPKHGDRCFAASDLAFVELFYKTPRCLSSGAGPSTSANPVCSAGVFTKLESCFSSISLRYGGR